MKQLKRRLEKNSESNLTAHEIIQPSNVMKLMPLFAFERFYLVVWGDQSKSKHQNEWQGCELVPMRVYFDMCKFQIPNFINFIKHFRLTTHYSGSVSVAVIAAMTATTTALA